MLKVGLPDAQLRKDRDASISVLPGHGGTKHDI
jgi:hypothetical protein